MTGAGGYSTLVIRDALQAQLQKDRLRQEIIEAELAKIDRALNCISTDGKAGQESKQQELNEVSTLL